jgi:nucleoside-diphosphate-sugar epimerase
VQFIMVIKTIIDRAQVVESSIRAVIHHLDSELFERKKIFITGGTGFFGLWLLSTLKLLNDDGINFQVTVLSRDPRRFIANNPQWDNQTWLSFIQGDVKSFESPKAHFDYLIHAATDTSRVAHSDPLAIFSDVVDGTKRVLDYAVNSGIRRALLTSSGAVYGSQPADMDRIPDEAQFACQSMNTLSAYGEGKRVMEFMASVYANKYGLEPVSARCFAFIGPGLPLDQHFAVGNFIRDALYKRQISIKGNGLAIRSYLYAADLAVWLLKLLTSGKPNLSYNVGSEKYLNMRELAEIVRNELSPSKEISIQSDHITIQDPRSVYVPSITRAREQLSLDDWTPLVDAIRLTARYHTVE